MSVSSPSSVELLNVSSSSLCEESLLLIPFVEEGQLKEEELEEEELEEEDVEEESGNTPSSS